MTQEASRTEIREALLLAALPHVPFDGWTEEALAAGARDAGLDPTAARRFFPGGPVELVQAFSAWADARMVAQLRNTDLAALKIRERVACAVRARLEALAPYWEAVRRSVSFLALPTNGALGVQCLYRTVDDIWYEIGDRSVDFSFYTKRALLAGVLTSTTLYWLDDPSEEFTETWGYLDRRIEDVMRLHRATGRVQSVLSRLPNPFDVVRRFSAGR